MTKRHIEKFADQLQRDYLLADAFAKAVAAIAREAGHAVTEADVISHFIDEAAALRQRQQDIRISTMALGEEDGPRSRPLPRPDAPRMTTMAMGEEGNKPVTPPGRVTTLAVGEEGGKPATPPGRVTTQAVGEEGGKPKPPKPGK